jgi:hypothetical protein
MSYAPESIYLMHYSRVTGTQRLARLLEFQIHEFVRIARACADLPNAHEAVREAMLQLWIGLLREQGSTRSADEVAELLETDRELNAQGLLIWFERQRKSNMLG